MSRVPKSEIEVLSQEIDDEFGSYRLRAAGQRIHYVRVATDVFDEDTMCQPWLLIPQLPDFPYKGWTRMEASRESDGSLIPKLLFEALPAAETIWHPKSIDAVSLEKVRRHRSGVYGVLYSGLPTICQIICFAWQVPRIEHRTYAYPMIEEYRGLGDPVLLKKLQGDFAPMDDLSAGREALENAHRMKMVRGDVSRYNSFLDRSKEPCSCSPCRFRTRWITGSSSI
ncbi:hypothetical protein B0O99DRAFT_730087 [Bisporella sp. PMI_857]|nr:hypothetical protein B0O99DRAFT_730087 [Bisporella sp. PMI_857]